MFRFERSKIVIIMRYLAIFFVLCLLLTGASFAAQPDASQASEAGHQRLADLLEDEATRTALIEQLRRLGETDTAAALAVDPPPESIARRIAGFTQSIAQGTVTESNAAFHAFNGAWQRLIQADPNVLLWEMGEFVVLIGVTLLVFRLGGVLASFAFRALDQQAGIARIHGASFALAWLRRTLAIAGAAAVDLAIIAIAWLIGYGIALFLLGEAGEISLQESLFLNGFLAVELVRAVLRILLSPRGDNLGLIAAGSEENAYWYLWLSRMVFFLGYGLMLAVPLINYLLTPELGRAVAIVIMLIALLKAAVIVMQNRHRGRTALETLAQRMQSPFGRISLGMAARSWHGIVIAYLAAILVTAILYPEQALPFMLAATGQTLVAVMVGIGLAALLTQVILRRIELNDDLRAKFPLLEARLNAYIPTALKIARFTILAVVVAFIFDAWTPFDLGVWMVSDVGAQLLGRVISVALIIIMALLIWLVVASWIEFRLNPQSGLGEPNPRARTLLTIFRNAIAIVLVVLTVMVVLAEIGINIAPLLAGAGVLGLAIGFGSQRLVQDVITGVFIQLENAINVGDVVTAGGTTGVVERMTIRSLGLRDLFGTYHLLPFSSVDMVSNYMRDYAFHVGEYGVGYREDTDNVIVHLRAAFDELLEDPEHRAKIMDPTLEVHGVTALADSAVNVRVRIKTLPGAQFGIGREYNRLVKRHFDAAGIEIPFPHMTVYFGENKRGEAPPARISLIERSSGAAAQTQASDSVDPEAARANPSLKGDFDEADK